MNIKAKLTKWLNHEFQSNNAGVLMESNKKNGKTTICSNDRKCWKLSYSKCNATKVFST